jgi:predicted peroxiredoxin
MTTKVLIFCGSDDPERVYPPFMLGAGALAMEMDLTLFFTLSGLNIVRRGGAEQIRLEHAPKPVPEFLDIVREQGARLIACSAAFPMAGIEEEDLVEGVETGGVATFMELAEEADVVLTY